MPVKIRIEHDGQGWVDVFTSDGMKSAGDSAGERIASEACGGYGAGSPPFKYYPKQGSFTVLGFVSSTGPTGAIYQQRDKALSKAVHR